MGKSRTLANTLSASDLLADGQINTAKNPPIVQPALPWAM
jgi:hypothetical protein